MWRCVNRKAACWHENMTLKPNSIWSLLIFIRLDEVKTKQCCDLNICSVETETGGEHRDKVQCWNFKDLEHLRSYFSCFSHDYLMTNNLFSSKSYVILRMEVKLPSKIPSGTQQRCTSHKSNQTVILPSSRPEGNGLFREERGITKRAWAEIKNHVWKWQEGGKHLDSTAHIALLFIQQHFTIKLTYQCPNTNTHTHASRVFESIIRQQPNEDSCLPLQGDLALRWANKSFLRENYKAEAEIQPILLEPTFFWGTLSRD